MNISRCHSLQNQQEKKNLNIDKNVIKQMREERKKMIY